MEHHSSDNGLRKKTRTGYFETLSGTQSSLVLDDVFCFSTVQDVAVLQRRLYFAREHQSWHSEHLEDGGHCITFPGLDKMLPSE